MTKSKKAETKKEYIRHQPPGFKAMKTYMETINLFQSLDASHEATLINNLTHVEDLENVLDSEDSMFLNDNHTTELT